MKLAILAVILPTLAKGGLFHMLMKPGCEFDRETSSYVCVKIKDQFPKLYYGDSRLRCMHCTIEVLRNDTFPYKNTLTVFNLSEGKIQTIAPNAFKNLASVEHILLENNDISNISENAFRGLRRVFELHLEHNKLSILTPGFLNEFEAISVLMSHNNLVEIGAAVFKGLYSIMILDLSHNSINTLHTNSLQYLNGLEDLNLKGNKLCRLPMGVFKYVRGLRNLNLAENNFTSFPLGLFSPLRDLRRLNISYNQLKMFDSNILLPFREIILLDLSANDLRYLDVASIQRSLTTLQALIINDNYWECDVLSSMIFYLKNNKVDVSEHSYHRYDMNNINGIACIENEDLTQIKTVSEFLDLANTATSAGYC